MPPSSSDLKEGKALKSTNGEMTARWARRLAASCLVIVAATACVTTTQTDDPHPENALPDGKMFAFVSVGTDDSGVTTVGVDPAEMLTGEAARRKAVEDGVIAEGEDLPNDFYIANDNVTKQLVQLADGALITVISGDDTTKRLEIDLATLETLWDGSYTGQAVYGIVPATPIAMDLTVVDGIVTEAGEVYLP